MVHRLRWCLVAAFILASATGCSTEDAARERLTQDGYTDIELELAGDGRFTFSARKFGEICSGTIALQTSFTTTQSAISSACRSAEPPPVIRADKPQPTGLGRVVDYARESGRTAAAVVMAADDPVSHATRAILQALIAGDREWIAKNSLDVLNKDLGTDDIAFGIQILRTLGEIHLGVPTSEPRDGGRHMVTIEIQPTGGVTALPLTLKLVLREQRFEAAELEGPGYEAAYKSLDEAPQQLTFLGAYALDGDGVHPGVLRSGSDGKVEFVFAGVRRKKSGRKIVSKWDIEHLDEGTHETGTDKYETPGTKAFIRHGWSTRNWAPGRHRINLEFKDVHASETLRVSHEVRVVDPGE